MQYSDADDERISFRKMRATIIDPSAPIDNEGDKADADGDGVSDSKWIELDDITSNKGKPIYAAVRVIDNGAMLNVNTAYKFDPSDPNASVYDLNGRNQMQINLMALAGRAGDPPSSAEEMDLLRARMNNIVDVNQLSLYLYRYR